MKVELIRCKFNGTISYKYMPFDYCCERLKNNPCVVFTNDDLEYGTKDEYEDDKYIPQFCTSYTEVITSYEDEWEQTHNYPIAYCPHCNELIEISVVGKADCTDKYKEIQMLRKELLKKCRETDSKKEEALLRRKVHSLDEKIDSYYKLNEWDLEKYL